jgi:hypothetical protein
MAACAVTLRSPPSVRLLDQREKSPDSNPSAKMTSAGPSPGWITASVTPVRLPISS